MKKKEALKFQGCLLGFRKIYLQQGKTIMVILRMETHTHEQ